MITFRLFFTKSRGESDYLGGGGNVKFFFGGEPGCSHGDFFFAFTQRELSQVHKFVAQVDALIFTFSSCKEDQNCFIPTRFLEIKLQETFPQEDIVPDCKSEFLDHPKMTSLDKEGVILCVKLKSCSLVEAWIRSTSLGTQRTELSLREIHHVLSPVTSPFLQPQHLSFLCQRSTSRTSVPFASQGLSDA